MKPLLSLSAVPTLVIAVACTMPAMQPAALDPGANATLARTLAARGSQVYECRAVEGQPGQHAWAFVAPDAQLFDAHGQLVGHHGAGPYWEIVDGSRVEGRVLAKADAPDAAAIPWLLLDATDTGRAGMLTGVTRIQRVNTFGGKSPATACGPANDGAQARVPYLADYRFFTTPPRPIS